MKTLLIRALLLIVIIIVFQIILGMISSIKYIPKFCSLFGTYSHYISHHKSDNRVPEKRYLTSIEKISTLLYSFLSYNKFDIKYNVPLQGIQHQ